MKDVLADLGDRLHLLAGTNTDSGRATVPATFEGVADFKVEKETLFDVLTECRVVSCTMRTFGPLSKTMPWPQACRLAVRLAALAHSPLPPRATCIASGACAG